MQTLRLKYNKKNTVISLGWHSTSNSFHNVSVFMCFLNTLNIKLTFVQYFILNYSQICGNY